MGTDAGVKLDTGKTRLWSVLLEYFPRALMAVGDVSEFGANKYCVGGWKDVDNAQPRYRDALVRHLLARTIEEVDQDSGLDHDAHLAWNALATLELKLRGRELHQHDDVRQHEVHNSEDLLNESGIPSSRHNFRLWREPTEGDEGSTRSGARCPRCSDGLVSGGDVAFSLSPNGDLWCACPDCGRVHPG